MPGQSSDLSVPLLHLLPHSKRLSGLVCACWPPWMPVGSGAHPFRRDYSWLRLCWRQSFPSRLSYLALFRVPVSLGPLVSPGVCVSALTGVYIYRTLRVLSSFTNVVSLKGNGRVFSDTSHDQKSWGAHFYWLKWRQELRHYLGAQSPAWNPSNHIL